MKEKNALDVQQILERHRQWRRDEPDGQRAVFEREILQGFTFAGRDLTGAHFIGCDLQGSDFSGCNLSFAEFVCCDLRSANLQGAQAAAVSFQGSDLRQADLRNVYIGLGSSFAAADLRGAGFAGAHFKKTDFHSAWMTVSDLKGATFQEAYSPSGAPMHGPLHSPTPSPSIVSQFQRMMPFPGNADSPIVRAYEQGSGPGLLDRLEVANKAMTVLEDKGQKFGMEDLRKLANESKQAEKSRIKDHDRER